MATLTKEFAQQTQRAGRTTVRASSAEGVAGFKGVSPLAHGVFLPNA